MSDWSAMRGTASKNYIVATDDKTSVLIRRHEVADYYSLLPILHRHFRSISMESMVIQTNELNICVGRYVDIPHEVWADVGRWIDNIRVISRPSPTSSPASPSAQMQLFVRTPAGKTVTVTLPTDASVDNLVVNLQDREGIPPDQQKLIFGGKKLEFARQLADYGIQNQSTIDLVQIWRGGKPVIYLLSPLPLYATVRLSLVKCWSFSTIYPSAPIKSSESGQSIEWNVNTHEDHTMTDIGTRARISYLFWEAETNPGLPPSPPSSPRLGQLHSDVICPFDPPRAELNDTNSVVLPASTTALYLDKVLTVLGLHVEARTSFITYWLPSILKHDFIALRFLPQASYEHAAPLDVEPKPDLVVRVFMLFKRVCADELDEWDGSLSRASENIEFWKDVVGVDCDGLKDEALFRVLEWGGMETKN
ncbi:hypothetical protein IW261DRAFT_1513954 [Armillaria novae-zelandiae]|uniref:Ubiquitin-like domain-containing protein n=1 Tax=Armillaria novae-zelandiae TaxID=153914 RepID=A0AA39NSE4_9AGAR|nr:hypothetical protein IW261DRAFT_1513954 [Armillaria novae-zelandiae]